MFETEIEMEDWEDEVDSLIRKEHENPLKREELLKIMIKESAEGKKFAKEDNVSDLAYEEIMILHDTCIPVTESILSAISRAYYIGYSRGRDRDKK